MSSAERIRTAAQQLQDALAGYDPGSMRQMVRDLPALGAALDQVGQGVRAVADRAEQQWPTAGPVTEGLHSMAGDLQAAARTAGVADAFDTHHGGDIERHDAPRGGSRAAESRWDVGRADNEHSGGQPHTSGPAAPGPPYPETAATQGVPIMTAAAGTPEPGRRGHYNPDQPRATDGKWTKDGDEVGDVLGYADGENCHGTDQVIGTGTVPTNLALIEYPDNGVNQKGAFVEVATPKNGYSPLTGRESDGTGYCTPNLGPDEAEAMADRLDELAGMVESGYRPPKPTVHTRARQRIELLLQDNRAGLRDRIGVGEEDDFPLTTGQLLKLLVEADPTLSAPQTRHAVRAHAAKAAGGEDGTVWLDLEPDDAGGMRVVVTAVEGTESPDDDYWRPYAAQHTPGSARELAGKLRTFAQAARSRNRAPAES